MLCTYNKKNRQLINELIAFILDEVTQQNSFTILQKLLSQFTSGFLQNGQNCVQLNHRSQQVGFK